MAKYNGDKVRIKKDTKFLYNSENVSSADGVRLWYQKDKATGKGYYEGAVQLSNGQWVWVSTGGQLIVKEYNKKKYLTVKVKLTMGEGSKSDKYYD